MAAPSAKQKKTRRLDIKGTFNFRDAGATLRPRPASLKAMNLFRSDSLHDLDEEAQNQVLSLGIKTIIDLRYEQERTARPNVFAESPKLRYFSIPLFPEAPAMSEKLPELEEVYRLTLDSCQDQFQKIYTILSEKDSFPALVHCTAGKDRTGMVVALLLELAGLAHEQIAEDYAVTQENITEEYLDYEHKRASHAGLDWQEYQKLLGSPAKAMLDTLRHLKTKYSNTENYLKSLGLSAAQIEVLRQNISP